MNSTEHQGHASRQLCRRTLAALSTGLLALAAPPIAAAADPAVALNEVNCEGTDWIELTSTDSSAVELGGWVLSDDPLGADPPRADHRFTFPATTSIGPGEMLVLTRGDGGFPFGISCNDDTIRLGTPAAVLADEVEVFDHDPTPDPDTWGRYPDGTGPWRATVPTMGAANQPFAAEPGEDLAAWLYDPDRVVEIDLGIPSESRAKLEADPYEYAPGTFAMTGADGNEYGPLQVGIRFKGRFGSFRPLAGKAAFKVSIDHSVTGQRFFGLRRLALNNMVQDRSKQHEVITYEVFRAAGVPAPRTGYAEVSVDGYGYGLYVNVETMDRVALSHWFDGTAHLYEGAYDVDVTPSALGLFEVDEGSESDISDLAALAEALASSGPAPLAERLAGLADLGQMRKMWAIERFAGHWDGYSIRDPRGPNNYYLHADQSGLFSVLPWGADQTLERRLHFTGAGGLLFGSCLADAACMQAYRLEVEALPALVAPMELDTQVEARAQVLAPLVAADPRREEGPTAFAKATKALIEFLRARPADIGDPIFWEADIAPQTRIVGGPSGTIRRRSPLSRSRFAFAASEPVSRFECSLDTGPWRACDRVHTVVSRPGRHSLRVLAVDLASHPDLTPAIRTWRIRLRPTRG